MGVVRMGLKLGVVMMGSKMGVVLMGSKMGVVMMGSKMSVHGLDGFEDGCGHEEKLIDGYVVEIIG
jgi:hypothetical protein